MSAEALERHHSHGQTQLAGLPKPESETSPRKDGGGWQDEVYTSCTHTFYIPVTEVPQKAAAEVAKIGNL